MWDRLKARIDRQATTDDRSEACMSLRNEVRRLQLDLAERDDRMGQLADELERHRAALESRVAHEVAVRLERLLADVSTPVAQLVTQTHVVEVENRLVAAEDILIVAGRLVRSLQGHGLELVGTIGASARFDPNLHEAMSVEELIRSGEAVRIRIVGARYRGKVLRKAGVQKEG